MILHGGYIKRVKTAKKWRRKNGCGVQLDPPPVARGLKGGGTLTKKSYLLIFGSRYEYFRIKMIIKRYGWLLTNELTILVHFLTKISYP